MLVLKRLPEKHTLIKLGRPNKLKNTNMNTTRREKRQGGTNNNMCSASASADTVINKSTVCVQSAWLKI